jgi:hypothetical protein
MGSRTFAPSILALVAAAVAALGQTFAPTSGIELYVTALSLPLFIAGAFVAYLALLERADAGNAVELAACAVAGLLVMADVSVRFGESLGASASSHPSVLVSAAGIVAAGAVAVHAGRLLRLPRLHASRRAALWR